MRYFLTIISFISIGQLFGQNLTPESLGYRHLQFLYQKDTVDILVKSKKGDEQKRKPIFLFIQGSLPVPLILYDTISNYPIFVFNTDSLTTDYHLAVIGKPFIPLISNTKKLAGNFTYNDPKTGQFPKEYTTRNLIDYYVKRNIGAIQYLQSQPWVSKNKLVVAGHSEGAAIAAKLASVSTNITHLIYSSGNPLGRIMSIIRQSREAETDTTAFAENDFDTWKKIIASPNDLNSTGDTYKATYGFSVPPPIDFLKQIRIPVLVAYGTKDHTAPYIDYLRIEIIRLKKQNFTFMPYLGLEHNFFGFKQTGEIDYNKFYWNRVALDWYHWLQTK